MAVKLMAFIEIANIQPLGVSKILRGSIDITRQVPEQKYLR